MAVLSNLEIISKIVDKEITIEPFVYEHLQPASIDLTLDNVIKVFKKNKYTEKEIFDAYSEDIKNNFEELSINEHILKPNDFIIGQIQQKISLSKKYMGNIQNRNSIIRLGINVGLSSYINPGYSGKLPIVIKNIGNINIKLSPGMRICQLVIFDVFPEPSFDYSNKSDAKYQNEEGYLLSKLYEDVEFQDFNKKYKKSLSNYEKLLEDFLNNRIKEKSKELLNNLTEEQKSCLGLR